MKNIKRILAVCALSIFAFSSVGCEMIQKTPEAIKNTVLAKVGDIKITRGDVDEIADPYLESSYGENYESNAEIAENVKELRVQAINLLVEQKLMYKKAEELGVLPTKEEVEEETKNYIEQVKENLGGEEQFNSALEGTGMTLEEYTENLSKNIESNLILTKVSEELYKDITVSDEEIETYYNEHLDSYKSATVSHILIADEAKAKEVRERAVKGEDFATLAKEFSEDTGTKENGGSLGTVTYDTTQFVQEFTDGFKALKEGEISEPIKSDYGYHIIKVTDIKQETLDEAKDKIKTTLESQKQNEALTNAIEQWKTDYGVKTYEDRL